MWKLCLQHSVQRMPKIVNCYRRQITLLGTVVAQLLLLIGVLDSASVVGWGEQAKDDWPNPRFKELHQTISFCPLSILSQHSGGKRRMITPLKVCLFMKNVPEKEHINVQLDCISSLLAIFWSDLISWLLGGCSTNNARVWLHLIAIDVGLQYMKSPQKSSICQFSQNYFWIYFSIFHYAAISVGGWS